MNFNTKVFPWDNTFSHNVFEISAILAVTIFWAFLFVYWYKAYKSQWTIRKSSQYLMLLVLPIISFLLSISLNMFLSILIMLLEICALYFNGHERFNGYLWYEKQGITTIFPRYQKEEKSKWEIMSKTEKEEWRKKYCKNPFELKVLSCI